MIPLSETEKAYLLNNEQFSKRKQRYLRYRISQKLRRRDAAERGNSSRDAATPRASLVRIAPQAWQYESENINDKEGMGRVGVEPTTPAMSRRYPNQARPPAHYTVKKFVAQIYVVDRLYTEVTNQPFYLNFIKLTF
jgi:hypothetical protein